MQYNSSIITLQFYVTFCVTYKLLYFFNVFRVISIAISDVQEFCAIYISG